jgi:hypothetical protein
MVVEGFDGTRLGTVERFEIDATGCLTDILVRVGGRGACKRVAAQYIQSMQAGIVTLALAAADVMRLNDVSPQTTDDMLLEHMLFFRDVH